jgi:hypothetical protein
MQNVVQIANLDAKKKKNNKVSILKDRKTEVYSRLRVSKELSRFLCVCVR